MKKQLIIPILVAGLAAASIGASASFAQETTSGTPIIVQRLAERFGLQENEVQAVFDEIQAEHHAQLVTRLEEKLSADVTNGIITEAQKELILEKLAEMHAEHATTREAFHTLEPKDRQQAMTDRRATMEQHRAELEAWADEHDIDLQYLRVFAGGPRASFRGHGPR